jgi:hypothetical protein
MGVFLNRVFSNSAKISFYPLKTQLAGIVEQGATNLINRIICCFFEC